MDGRNTDLCSECTVYSSNRKRRRVMDLVLIGLLGLAGVVGFVIIKEVFQWGYNKVNKK